ncbi:hypothetical protein F511_41520 [Dorcoceras hygrometricum]|uniref:Uncharacterized protein n=1 Tax=Dorcoceras hygrometricum TaxID=472368 RepID=A0A2Z7CUJ0_9LAMI|nr:hypothetical protein F511_41520 [Dorcoceras hygrometricum]
MVANRSQQGDESAVLPLALATCSTSTTQHTAKDSNFAISLLPTTSSKNGIERKSFLRGVQRYLKRAKRRSETTGIAGEKLRSSDKIWKTVQTIHQVSNCRRELEVVPSYVSPTVFGNPRYISVSRLQVRHGCLTDPTF